MSARAPGDLGERISRPLRLLEGSAATDYIGEGVSQLDHALQAAWLAQRAGGSDALVLAALLHDVGHLCAPQGAAELTGLGIALHEEIGAAWLAGLGFGEDVTGLVRAHVAAKRYLTWRRPDYRERLSEASRRTLEHQGGPMSDAEARAFEADPRFEEALRLRHFDDAAKRRGLRGPGLESFRPRLERHLRGSG